MSSVQVQTWLNSMQRLFRIWRQISLQLQRFRRLYQIFEVYVLSIITEAFYSKGYIINLHNPPNVPQNVFRVKLSPRGSPHNFSILSTSKSNNVYYIANNIGIGTRHTYTGGLTLTPDIAILNSFPSKSRTPANNLEAFIECKNMRPFPELLVTFEGLIYRFHNIHRYISTEPHIYDALFLSGSSTTAINNYINSIRGYQVRIYTNVKPGNISHIQQVIADFAQSIP